MENGKFLTQPTRRGKHTIDGLVESNRIIMWASIPGEGKRG